MSMGNRHFFPHITNFQFELCQKINTLCCQLGSCHRACPRSLRRLSRFHLARSSTLARALRAALASRVGVCWLLRGSRPSDEAPGSQHPCDCRAPRPRHNIDPRERERARATVEPWEPRIDPWLLLLPSKPTTTAHS